MDSILIQGGSPLVGEIKISGSKNASLPIMAASILTSSPLKLSGIPTITDIFTMIHLLEHHGVKVKKNGDKVTLQSDDITNFIAPYDIVRKMRASIWVLGPLLARFGKARVSLPGGCAIGSRQVDMHLAGLEAMGATITIEHGYINAHVDLRLKGIHFNFDKKSVGATITMILAASLADGETKLMNAASEPEIVDLCNCLVQMGAKIQGIGTDSVTIMGQKELRGATHKVIPDRIEAGTYMIAAIMTRGDITLRNISYDMVENIALKLIEAGAEISSSENSVRVKHSGPINSVNIETKEYPGFATDLQAQFMALMTLSDGVSIVTENIFENRFMHVPELCRMGAYISIIGHSATIRGGQKLVGAEVMASDLRASVSLVLAGLVAEGETKLRRIYHIDRGYENVEAKLKACGARIERVKGDVV
ncbi:MAG: UDP-N-acetylglucosamine 1-carboxyvinyltransferase [Pseudomonadota bacterium]